MRETVYGAWKIVMGGIRIWDNIWGRLIRSVNKRKFAASVQKKGFLEVRNRDHAVVVFTDPTGKQDAKIQTKMCHGAGNDISDKLLAFTAKQMTFGR